MQQPGAGRTRFLRLTVASLFALAGLAGCTTTATTRTTTTTGPANGPRIAQVDPSEIKKPKSDASGKHRHEHCHIKGNGKNEVCHDHPHEGGPAHH